LHGLAEMFWARQTYRMVPAAPSVPSTETCIPVFEQRDGEAGDAVGDGRAEAEGEPVPR
jgi:hypothetical protein